MEISAICPRHVPSTPNISDRGPSFLIPKACSKSKTIPQEPGWFCVE